MRVLVTGHQGYIGAVLVPMLLRAGHDVIGLDTGWYAGCGFGVAGPSVRTLRRDVRDAEAPDLEGFDAVIHLAALSNDPLGDLNPDCTYGINHRGSVRLAGLARAAGVPRFLFASSCALYGRAGDAPLTEDAAFNPVTAYGESKVRAERDIAALADSSFSPAFFRCATAYGVSPMLRADLVVNNLVGHAWTTGEVRVGSDGTPWRPLVHVEDIAAAYLAGLGAPLDRIHNQAFNVGLSAENYQIRDVAAMVAEVVPGSRIVYAEGGGPDPRCYRVNCDKIAEALPEFRPRWNVRRGIEELFEGFRRVGLTREEFLGIRYLRTRRVKQLLLDGRLDAELHWVRPAATGVKGNKPRLSIGLPVFNGAKTLESTVRGLLEQSFGDFELIISDNASTDDTERISRAFAAADPRVRYVRNATNIGLAANFNRVFGLSRGELFKWAAADDVCLPGYLEACIAVLDARPDVVLAYGKAQFIDAEDHTLSITDPGWNLPQESSAERFRQVLRAGHWVNSLIGVIRSEALARTRLLPGYPGGDYILLGELSLLGKLIEVPQVLFRRRLHAGSNSQHGREPEWLARYWGDRAASRPLWARSRGHLGSILHADLPLRRKAGLVMSALKMMRRRRDRLWAEIREELASPRSRP